ALLATDANRARFEHEREAIVARNAEAKATAEASSASLEGTRLVLIRQAGDTGQLYGSVSGRDVAEAATEAGQKVAKSQVRLNAPIKTIGLHDVRIRLHAEVEVTISVNVARSEDEAERQAAGENIIEALAAEQQAQASQQADELAEAAAEMADQMMPDEDA
ncbi:MAG: 50S ribosomal protein L9, partial [Pseudomonadota bacterium]